MFLETMQSNWGFIFSRRLFFAFGNLTWISTNIRTFVNTNNKRKRNEKCFEQVFHIPYITRNVKHDCSSIT